MSEQSLICFLAAEGTVFASDVQRSEISQGQAAPRLTSNSIATVLPNPPCPIRAAKIAGLQATVLLLNLLIKSRVQIKVGSALGFSLLALQPLVFLAATGALGLTAIAAGTIALGRRQAQAT